jgi:hypothetical protein
VYLKLAVSIHTQPIFTSHLSASVRVSTVPSGTPVAFACNTGFLNEHGSVREGEMYPLSLANCSKQMGRNNVKDTMTNTSLYTRRFQCTTKVSGKAIHT